MDNQQAPLPFVEEENAICLRNPEGVLLAQVVVEPGEDGHLELTEEGRKLAQKVLDKHLVLTGFLKQIGVSADVAEEDACLLEHSLSNESFEKLRLWMEQQKKDGDK